MSKPSQTIFFTDRALGKRVAESLSRAGANVKVHAEYFAPDSPDIEWLSTVSQHGWIVLTKDTRIRFNPLEIQTIASVNARVFILVSGNLSLADMANAFVRALPAMERFVQGNQPPFIAKLYKTGRILLWKNQTQLRKLLKPRDDK